MKTFTIALAAIAMTAAANAALAKTTSMHSPESVECSKQADAKGLHGKERKKFRAECKKELKAKASTTSLVAPPVITNRNTSFNRDASFSNKRCRRRSPDIDAQVGCGLSNDSHSVVPFARRSV
jgi:hypothetical protein